jgi:predicted aspartyl protease
MKIQLVGRIVDAEPRFPSRIVGRRLLLDDRGRDQLILDSGFTGSVAIPEEWANRLELRYAGIQTFELANGQIVEFPTYLGAVQLGQAAGLFEIVVTAEALLGMEFFERLKARIVIDWRTKKVSCTGNLRPKFPSPLMGEG